MDELILKEREFKENIVQLINTSGMPAFILKPIIKELFEQLNLLEQKQYEDACIKKKNEEEKTEEDKHE